MENDPYNKVLCGDCENVLLEYPDGCIDLIVTSPPYADARKKTYGGIPPDEYVNWFLTKSSEFLRVLKPTGSFILNIKENVVNGERSTYVYELVLAMRKQGWLWTDEYIWHKRNSYPGKWPNRFRDAWEHCYHFTKGKKFAMYQDEVKVPIGDWTKRRLAKLSPHDITRTISPNGSGFGRRIAYWVDKTTVYPTNVLTLPTQCSNKGHSAVFPEALPNWFIRLFTQPGDVVLDPFCGSGTTIYAAHRLGRKYIGIDILQEYCDMSISAVKGVSPRTLIHYEHDKKDVASDAV